MKKDTKNKKKSKFLEFFSVLWSSERGRALLFFCFYALFFIFVASFVRTSHHVASSFPKDEYNQSKQKDNSYSYHFTLIEKENYHFRYLVTVGEDVSLYEGDRLDKKELFTTSHNFLVTSYYRDGDLFVKKQNDLWISSDNPYLFSEFYSVSTIQKVLKQASLSSRTEYSSGEYELKFTISTKLLLKVLTGEDIMLSDDLNEVVLLLDHTQNVVSVRYDLTNYYTYIQKIPQKLHLEFQYSKFGDILEIAKP